MAAGLEREGAKWLQSGRALGGIAQAAFFQPDASIAEPGRALLIVSHEQDRTVPGLDD